MEIIKWFIEDYVAANGRNLFDDWIQSLCDKKTQQIIYTRLDRLRLGNFGQCKSVGGGVFEIKISHGPGYRVYFGFFGRQIILILLGGDKKSQSKDIRLAQQLWHEHLRRTK